MHKFPKSIFKCLSGQIISLFFVYKYTFPFTPSTFATDAFLVPLTCLICFSYKSRIYKERNLRGGLISGILYFFYINKMISGANEFSKDYTVLVFGLGFLIALIFSYLIIGKVEFNILQYLIYGAILIITCILVFYNTDLCGVLIVKSSGNNSLSIIAFVSYTVLTNIFTNEVGIVDYLTFSSLTPVVLYVIAAMTLGKKEIYTEPILDNILYYLVSLTLHISTVIYLQIYGILSFNILHVSNLLMYLFIRGYDKIAIGGMYISLIATNLLYK